MHVFGPCYTTFLFFFFVLVCLLLVWIDLLIKVYGAVLCE